MNLTVLESKETVVDARIDRDQIWIATDDLDDAIGWVHEPEGLCRGAVCVPVRSS